MPREIVHWDIAHRALLRLPIEEAPILRQITVGNEAAIALGAVTHDAPYYRRGGGSEFEWVGAFLHGLGEKVDYGDTLLPLSRFGEFADSLTDTHERATSLSFLLGLLSHYAVDVVFHPWVFFFTGNYYAVDDRERAAARARHRLLEVYLDEDRRASGLALPWSMKISNLLKSIPHATLGTICAGLEVAIEPTASRWAPELVGQLRAEWHAALRELALFQRLFVSTGGGIGAMLLNRLSLNRLFPYEALFARGRRGVHPLLQNIQSYQNPISGELASSSIAEMDEQAIELTLKLYRIVERGLAAGRLTASTLSGGVSLNYGQKDSAPEDATHFSERGIDLPGLRF